MRCQLKIIYVKKILRAGEVHSSGEVFHEHRDLKCKLKEGKARLGMLAIQGVSLRLDFHRIASFLRCKKAEHMHMYRL